MVARTAYYQSKHPGIAFQRVAATNHWFNQTAADHAGVNAVELLDGPALRELLTECPITRFEVEALAVETLG